MSYRKIIFSLLLCLFLGCIKVSAATVATVTGNEVSFRSGAGTNNPIVTYLYRNNQITLESTTLHQGIGCTAGWYKGSFNGKNGYVCAAYVNVPEIGVISNYNLPWTSPKKAILGGASFIANDYISAGQYTSYLKKYNVNPSGSYSVYTHQYMANLAAPMHEAASSYRSYKENGLLSLALHFTIPIYNNMPEYTTHPRTGKEVGGTSEVKDASFEETLNKEGFDETYKKWLRSLHEQYPNWTFSSLKTNLDFNTSVQREKLVGSISSCTECFEQPLQNTEGSWYIANTQTVEYFLDPRNFLMADSILMFEDLSYTDYYTESMVLSVLKGTFMTGKDNVDNISYSSMFMEAGKTYNVSPIYLASLSKQEVGSTIGLVTSGNRFEYQGQIYEGFYNFYNIGAYSSAENPAKAGLVYASNGASKNSEGVYAGNIGSNNNNNNTGKDDNKKDDDKKEDVVPVVTPVSTHLSNMGLNQKGEFVTNLSLNATAGSLKSKTIASEVTIKRDNGSLVGDSEKVHTGDIITFSNGESRKVVIYGDLTGDGEINSADLLRMRQVLLKKVTLTGAYLEASHVYTTSGAANSSDLLRLRQYLLGKKGINQA